MSNYIPNINGLDAANGAKILTNCRDCGGTGSVTRPIIGIREGCLDCRAADLLWQPYRDEMRLRWLNDKKAQNRLTESEKRELASLLENKNIP